MTASGRQLSIDEALALCKAVGFRNDQLVRAVAVMTAESGRHVGAIGINPDPPSIDRGLFQVNSIHDSLSNEASLMPVPNAEVAKAILDGAGWTAWTTYDSGAYKAFTDEIRARFDADEYVALIPYADCF